MSGQSAGKGQNGRNRNGPGRQGCAFLPLAALVLVSDVGGDGERHRASLHLGPQGRRRGTQAPHRKRQGTDHVLGGRVPTRATVEPLPRSALQRGRAAAPWSAATWTAAQSWSRSRRPRAASEAGRPPQHTRGTTTSCEPIGGFYHPACARAATAPCPGRPASGSAHSGPSPTTGAWTRCARAARTRTRLSAACCPWSVG